jgi:predicted restriction endonuclease
VKRDRELVKDLKTLYDGHCQICVDTFEKVSGGNYSEAAHIVPLSRRLPGVDSGQNIVVLCAMCHKKLDLGGMEISWDVDAGQLTYLWQGQRAPVPLNKHINGPL